MYIDNTHYFVLHRLDNVLNPHYGEPNVKFNSFCMGVKWDLNGNPVYDKYDRCHSAFNPRRISSAQNLIKVSYESFTPIKPPSKLQKAITWLINKRFG